MVRLVRHPFPCELAGGPGRASDRHRPLPALLRGARAEAMVLAAQLSSGLPPGSLLLSGEFLLRAPAAIRPLPDDRMDGGHLVASFRRGGRAALPGRPELLCGQGRADDGGLARRPVDRPLCPDLLV